MNEPLLHPGYWDCECITDYIHRKDIDVYCVKCDSFQGDQPDSHHFEVINILTEVQ